VPDTFPRKPWENPYLLAGFLQSESVSLHYHQRPCLNCLGFLYLLTCFKVTFVRNAVLYIVRHDLEIQIVFFIIILRTFCFAFISSFFYNSKMFHLGTEVKVFPFSS
jgi:hypothetical protein